MNWFSLPSMHSILLTRANVEIKTLHPRSRAHNILGLVLHFQVSDNSPTSYIQSSTLPSPSQRQKDPHNNAFISRRRIQICKQGYEGDLLHGSIRRFEMVYSSSGNLGHKERSVRGAFRNTIQIRNLPFRRPIFYWSLVQIAEAVNAMKPSPTPCDKILMPHSSFRRT